MRRGGSRVIGGMRRGNGEVRVDRVNEMRRWPDEGGGD